MERIAPRRSLREEVTAQLRAAIVAGHLRPGVVHSVPVLAAQFGVSATPVREAILDLAKEGLIGIVKNKGFRISALSDEELDEITEVRELLEIPAVAACAGKLSTDQLSELETLAVSIVDAARAGDLAAYLAADAAFHKRLLGTGKNRQLMRIILDLRNRTRLYGLDALVESKQLIHSAEEHVELVKLLRAGRREPVARLMRRHLSHVRGIWAGTTAD
ncbi:GntR family transcriptional regulator [Allorhizocola rhizosphaerae]|uniref:GntR family transcriptional regulator n=1 Tax=Allorhizocola rhizosphaerae TaxID=1872709 RepID=UPI001FEB0C75|nr:GntR family transcriptional regulator [Allorhizocola rhizosphaerae]